MSVELTLDNVTKKVISSRVSVSLAGGSAWSSGLQLASTVPGPQQEVVAYAAAVVEGLDGWIQRNREVGGHAQLPTITKHMVNLVILNARPAHTIPAYEWPARASQTPPPTRVIGPRGGGK